MGGLRPRSEEVSADLGLTPCPRDLLAPVVSCSATHPLDENECPKLPPAGRTDVILSNIVLTMNVVERAVVIDVRGHNARDASWGSRVDDQDFWSRDVPGKSIPRHLHL